MTGTTVEWRCDPDTAVQRIYFGNHSSHLDFVVIWSALPPRLRRHARPVAGRDYWHASAIRRYLAINVFRAVLIDRGSSGAVARGAAVDRAHDPGDGRSRFPHRVSRRNAQRRRQTSARSRAASTISARAKPDAELIPVLLENLNRILPKGEALPVPMLSRVTFGPPLQTGRDDAKDEFLARARTALLRLKDDE